MKEIHVAAAVIVRDGKVFCTQRVDGGNRGKWEFPGGKCEPGESFAQAAVREIREELAADITAGPEITAVRRTDGEKTLTVHFLLCRLSGGEPKLLEHQAGMWLDPEELPGIEFLAADRCALPQIISLSAESRTGFHGPSESHH